MLMAPDWAAAGMASAVSESAAPASAARIIKLRAITPHLVIAVLSPPDHFNAARRRPNYGRACNHRRTVNDPPHGASRRRGWLRRRRRRLDIGPARKAAVAQIVDADGLNDRAV